MSRILVLESYLPLAQAIAELLRRAGWDVTARQMAREALQALAEEHCTACGNTRLSKEAARRAPGSQDEKRGAGRMEPRQAKGRQN
jgi:CheY-like chemotaxis protein